MEELKEINKKAVELAEKRTWVRKGMKELIRKMNEELHIIDDGDVYKAVLIEYEDEWEGIYWCYEDGKISIQKYDAGSKEWEGEVNIDEIEAYIVRKAIEKLPDFIRKILGRYDEVNEKYRDAVEDLNKYLSA